MAYLAIVGVMACLALMAIFGKADPVETCVRKAVSHAERIECLKGADHAR